jgi:acyl-CoA synthetase (AMP-forming)/AMP-acid ligase II
VLARFASDARGEINDEVDWYLELVAIFRRTAETLSPGAIFNKVKGCPAGFRVTDFGMAKSGTRVVVELAIRSVQKRRDRRDLYAHLAILEASVVGIPDRVWGEVPIAFVQLKPGHQSSAQELMDFCREKLASYKVPRIWRFVEQFPQTASGKIQEFMLRDGYLSHEARSVERDI